MATKDETYPQYQPLNPIAAGLMAAGDAISGIYGQRGNTYATYLDAQVKRWAMEQELAKTQRLIDQQAIENQNKQAELLMRAQGLKTDEKELMMNQGYRPMTAQIAQNISSTQGPQALRQFMGQTARDAFGQRYQQPLTMQDRIDAATKQFAGNIPVGTTIYDKKTGMRTMLNRPLSEDEKASVSMVNYSTPRIKRIETLIDEGTRGGSLLKDLIIEKNGQLFVTGKGKGNENLEELVGLVNQIKVSGFALGGKNFTESEQKLIWGYLNPVGKSNEQYKKDINAANDILKGKANLTIGGMNEANRMMSSLSNEEVDLDGIF